MRKNDDGLPKDDIDFINKSLSEEKGSSVKGKEVWLCDDFPDNKEEAALHLAIVLKDETNVAYYQMLTRDRRIDFLKNCLIKTLLAKQKGSIQKTLAKYFTGVVKNQTEQQKRLEIYKKKHKSLYGY